MVHGLARRRGAEIAALAGKRAHGAGHLVEFQRRQFLHVGGETLRYLGLRTELIDGERTAQAGTRIVMTFAIVGACADARPAQSNRGTSKERGNDVSS